MNKDHNRLLSGFLRLLAALLALLYLFGFAWYPTLAPYALVDLLCAFGMAWRCGAGERYLLSARGFTFAMAAGVLVMLDQGYLAVRQFKGAPNLSMALVLAAAFIMIFDASRFRRKSAKER
ncbi:MAG: hypothetical protein WBN40_04735 [Pseudomonadales bacterium]